MDSKKFEKIVKAIVVEYTNSARGFWAKINEDDVYIVWSCKTLQNNKALAATKLRDGMYYELTYNGDKDELYVEAYKKWENICIKNPGQ